MKLIGSYTPSCEKSRFSCWRKGLNLNSSMNSPTTLKTASRSTTRWGVPALVTDEGEYWFDSPIIAEYIELLGVAPNAG
jgi:hypothetical protein